MEAFKFMKEKPCRSYREEEVNYIIDNLIPALYDNDDQKIWLINDSPELFHLMNDNGFIKRAGEYSTEYYGVSMGYGSTDFRDAINEKREFGCEFCFDTDEGETVSLNYFNFNKDDYEEIDINSDEEITTGKYVTLHLSSIFGWYCRIAASSLHDSLHSNYCDIETLTRGKDSTLRNYKGKEKIITYLEGLLKMVKEA